MLGIAKGDFVSFEFMSKLYDKLALYKTAHLCINPARPRTLVQSQRRWGGCVYRVAILEPAPRGLAARLGDFLLALEQSPPVQISHGTDLTDFSGAYDLFVADSFSNAILLPADLSCRALLLPGGVQMAAFSQIPSKWVVSFGLSSKDSITVSSLTPDSALLALQRELVTLSGQVIEQQEIPISIPPSTSASGVMAFYGALLLLGVPPKRLAV